MNTNFKLTTFISAIALCALVSSCGVLEPTAQSNQSPLFVGDAERAVLSGNTTDTTRSGLFSNSPIVQIFDTDSCHKLSRGGFIWFTDPVVLNDWLSPLEAGLASRIGSEVNFNTHGALLIDYGPAASPGAGAEVLGEGLTRAGSDAIVVVRQIKSPKNKRQAQVVSHPCALYAMPRTGYKKLLLHSEQGDLLTSFDNP